MGNVIESFFSGFGRVIGNLFGSPLDFLSGKSCSTVCGTTWDFICYIENFCLAHLLKIAMVSLLLYIVLLFLYLLHKLGVCSCIFGSLCKMAWGCCSLCFSAWECCCSFLCLKLPRLRGRNRNRFHQAVYDSSCYGGDESERFSTRPEERRRPRSRPWKDYRASHLRKSLRPRSHRIRVGISAVRCSTYGRTPIKHRSTVHDFRVTQTSKFVQKGRRRWQRRSPLRSRGR